VNYFRLVDLLQHKTITKMFKKKGITGNGAPRVTQHHDAGTTIMAHEAEQKMQLQLEK
jgi:hypothetical protein